MIKLRRLPHKILGFLRELSLLGWLVLVVFALVVGGGAYWSWQHFHAQSEQQIIIEKVGKLAVLPDETPVIATVEDASRVNQPFLKDAQNGDKTLIFPGARKVILYRPKTNQIVNMGPVLTTLVPVFVRSGAPSAKVDEAIKQIRSQSVNFNVVSQDTSPKNNYQQTLVIDLTGARSSATEQLAQLLHGSVATLPDGETRPDADILVIVGSSNN
jgi:hypothetical protein